ncbi:MAG: hypothetical protein NTW87_09105 [Planctomycetota bacterium]|nr:hypothetical protein [Planctomycetota bacterium]
MSTVEEIRAAIEALSAKDRARLARWLQDQAEESWDEELAADAASGKLAPLLAEVDRDIEAGNLHTSPW